MRLITTKNGKSEKIIQESVCPILDICGRCLLLDLPYKDQLFRKAQVAKEEIFELGAGFEHTSVKDCVPSPEKLGYRHAVHLMISEYKPKTTDGTQKRRIDIGFYQPSVRRVVDIGRCPIQNIALNHVLAWLRTGIRIHNVSIHTSAQKTGLLMGVSLYVAQNSKQIFVCFMVTKLNSAALRPLACDIAAKFSNVRGIFMRLNDDAENKDLKLLTGHSDIQEKFLHKIFHFTLKSELHPNLPLMEKLVIRINELKQQYGEQNSLSVLTTNQFLPVVIECQTFEDVLAQKPKMICVVSAFSNSAKSMLKTLHEHGYQPLFVEPFDVLPGTEYFENVILLERVNG